MTVKQLLEETRDFFHLAFQSCFIRGSPCLYTWCVMYTSLQETFSDSASGRDPPGQRRPLSLRVHFRVITPPKQRVQRVSRWKRIFQSIVSLPRGGPDA